MSSKANTTSPKRLLSSIMIVAGTGAVLLLLGGALLVWSFLHSWSSTTTSDRAKVDIAFKSVNLPSGMVLKVKQEAGDGVDTRAGWQYQYASSTEAGVLLSSVTSMLMSEGCVTTSSYSGGGGRMTCRELGLVLEVGNSGPQISITARLL